jgi:hypothetical protein
VRHHRANVGIAFWGWNRAWLDPGFRQWNLEEYLPGIRVPVLLIQGEHDEYGTARQLDAIANGCVAPVERLVLERCGHAPHRDQPEPTLAAVAQFVNARYGLRTDLGSGAKPRGGGKPQCGRRAPPDRSISRGLGFARPHNASIQHLPHLAGQGAQRERLGHELGAGHGQRVLRARVVRARGDDQHLRLRAPAEQVAARSSPPM